MKARVLSALIGVPPLLAVVLWPGGNWPFPGWPCALLGLLLMLGALHEFYGGCREFGLTPRDWLGFGLATYFLLLATPLIQDPAMLPLGFTTFILVSLVSEVARTDRSPLKSLGPTWMGALYIGWLLPFAVRLRLATPGIVGLPEPWNSVGEGGWLLLFTIAVTSSVDIFALVAGKAFGKHKLAPVLSPGKTVEGAVGGFLAAIVVAGLLAQALRLPLAFALTAGTLIGLLAQCGDLAKSAIKREIGVKDFGNLIPGHGGVLDRFDSLLFTAPVVYWLLHLRSW